MEVRLFLPKPLLYFAAALLGLYVWPVVVPIALIAGAAYLAWRHFQQKATRGGAQPPYSDQNTGPTTVDAETISIRPAHPSTQSPNLTPSGASRSQTTGDGTPEDKGLKETVAILHGLGFEVLPLGVGFAVMSAMSGYSSHETASFIILHTFAGDARKAGNSVTKIIQIASATPPILAALTDFFVSGLMRKELYQNDRAALMEVVSISPNQDDWIQKVLANVPSGEKSLAVRRAR